MFLAFWGCNDAKGKPLLVITLRVPIVHGKTKFSRRLTLKVCAHFIIRVQGSIQEYIAELNLKCGG